MLAETTYTPLNYNPFAPGFCDDPYPQLHRLRTSDPVHWSPTGGCWVITRYDDCLSILNNRNFGIRMDLMSEHTALKKVLDEPFQRILWTQILSSDPPRHTRIRAVMQPYFTAGTARDLRSRIQAVVDGLIDGLDPSGEMDFIKDFALKIPFGVISKLMGIPEDESAPLRHWTNVIVRSTDPTPMTRFEIDAANDAAEGFRDYFLELAARRRTEPTNDVFTALVRAWDDGTIEEEEMISNAMLVFIAGHDTTVNYFGNSMLALFRNPQQIDLLRKQPELWPNGAKELLRYDTTLQIARRVPDEPTMLRGRMLDHGSYCLLCLGAANRDPAVFPDPDRLDVTRENIRPLSFGGGIHTCLGSKLAPLEVEVGIGTLLNRLPTLRPVTLSPPWKQNVYIRGPVELRVNW